MAARICVVLSLLALPVTLSLWFKSRGAAEHWRYDVTLYKSMWLYLDDGICGIEVLTMPSRTPSRSEFHGTFNPKRLTKYGKLNFWSRKEGPYHRSWLVFPLWMVNAFLMTMLTAGLLHGPYRAWRRRLMGHCPHCGYDLQGNRRAVHCPECGASARLKLKRT